MKETRTAAILQRVPAILAVTANSYGLAPRAADSHRPRAAAGERPSERDKTGGKPAAQR